MTPIVHVRVPVIADEFQPEIGPVPSLQPPLRQPLPEIAHGLLPDILPGVNFFPRFEPSASRSPRTTPSPPPSPPPPESSPQQNGLWMQVHTNQDNEGFIERMIIHLYEVDNIGEYSGMYAKHILGQHQHH
ncbi:hypothetical protein L484_004001 [Morus notabilis]|uniref:Uncharacterized protein n=1 Tax=Morus notabilis TaxID=981085 RepID=W9RYF2_9ROSA|nr:hypothetical protein L484_004001 [Morus notabilis]